jgi:beta-glucosidase-like glycosyl hydrolase
MDMVMVPERYKDFYAALKDLAQKGEVPMSRIDDAVLRILRVKYALGLLEPWRSPLADRSLHARFGSPEHRAVARRAVHKSLVLLKNERRALPLSKTAKRIQVAGKNADDIGNQWGGWTIDWQGKSGAGLSLRLRRRRQRLAPGRRVLAERGLRRPARRVGDLRADADAAHRHRRRGRRRARLHPRRGQPAGPRHLGGARDLHAAALENLE